MRAQNFLHIAVFITMIYFSEVVLQELSDEQKQQIMSSQDFRSFFDSASRIVEKALSEEVDVGFLYSGEGLLDR